MTFEPVLNISLSGLSRLKFLFQGLAGWRPLGKYLWKFHPRAPNTTLFRRFFRPLKMWTKIYTLSEGSFWEHIGSHIFLDLFCLVILFDSFYHWDFSRNTTFYALQLKRYSFFVTPFWGCSTNQPRKGWGKFCVFLVWPGADWSTCAHSISTSSGGLCRVIWNSGWVGGHFWALPHGLMDQPPPPRTDPPEKRVFFIRP